MFHGQFGQGQGQQVSNWPKTIIRSIHCSCLKVKFRIIQVIAFTRNHTDNADEDDDDNRTK